MLKIAHHPLYKHPLPEGHRFPMEKYELLPEQLIYEGTCTAKNFFQPEIPADEDILRVHSESYFQALLEGRLDRKSMRKIGFPWSKELITRERIIVDGTIKAGEYALENGIAMNIAGGTHHAYSDQAEGFCIFNDQAIGARFLQHKNLVKKILIVDLDVHQGNGTAEIFQNDPSVFTFSMHGKHNYPFQKEKSNLDIELNDGTRDDEYLSLLKETLPTLIQAEKPDFIFYLSGVDILKSDKLGRLACTIAGCKERDRFVLQTCRDFDIPVECSMGGGYSARLKDILEAHANTYRMAQEIYFS